MRIFDNKYLQVLFPQFDFAIRHLYKIKDTYINTFLKTIKKKKYIYNATKKIVYLSPSINNTLSSLGEPYQTTMFALSHLVKDKSFYQKKN